MGRATESADRPNRLRRAAIVVTVVGLVALGLAVGLEAVSRRGAATPHEAADRFLAAAAAEDAPALLAALAPAEQDVLGGALGELTVELDRLGLLPDPGTETLAGLRVDLDSPAFETTSETEDLAVVTVSAGRLTVDLDTAEAFTYAGAEAARELFGIEPGAAHTERDFANEPLTLVAVDDGDGWTVSLFLSLAEAFRGPPAEEVIGANTAATALAPGSTRAPATTTAPGPAAASDDPEATVRTLLERLLAADRDAVDRLVVREEGGPLAVGSDLLFPTLVPGRADIARTSRVDDLDLEVTEDGDRRSVRVRRLRATISDAVMTTELVLDDTDAGRCFDVAYRFAGDAEPFGRFRSCDGATPEIELRGAGDERLTEREQERERERERDAGATTSLPATDAFGQPFGAAGGDEEAIENAVPSLRPFDNALSAMALFGGGAELPTFVLVEVDGAWYVSPARTLLTSLVETLRATSPEQTEQLIDRFHSVIGTGEIDLLTFEARDPDNVLFGPGAVANTPTIAACFTEVRAVVGARRAEELFGRCVAGLIAAGDADPAQVAPMLLFRDCLEAHPSEPPALDDPYRRLYATDLARSACVRTHIDEGTVPAEVLDRIVLDEPNPCFAPYLPLAPTDPEERWAAADAEVAACVSDRLAR